MLIMSQIYLMAVKHDIFERVFSLASYFPKKIKGFFVCICTSSCTIEYYSSCEVIANLVLLLLPAIGMGIVV